MRAAAALAVLLHAAAVALLVAYGTPRPLAEAETDGPGIPVIFSMGGGGETPGEEEASDPPWTAAAAGGAPMAGPAEAEARQETVAAEETPEDTPSGAADAPAEVEQASPLPRPPPPPPDPPPPRAQARPRPPGPAIAERAAGEGEAGPPSGEGAAALLLATREATVGRRVDPVVPVEARRARMQGTVVLAVTISPEGVPSAVDVVRSSGHLLLDRAAQEALWQWRFDPARRQGVPVEERIAIPISFRIVD